MWSVVSRSTSKVVILGCGGFIGSHLLERLLTDGSGVFVEGVDRTPVKIARLIDHPLFRFHNIDLRDIDEVRRIIAGSDTVISLAALCNPYLYTTAPIEVIESNFVDMYPVVQACSDLGKRLVHFSTSEVYGRTINGWIDGGESGPALRDITFSEEATPLCLGPVGNQRWCYAAAKQLLERTIFAYGFERGLDFTIVRPFNFIGQRMDYIPGIDGEGVPRVFACFMDALLHGKPLRLVDGGLNRRCFTSIDDAVDAIMLILENPDASRRRIFNIGNPENETTIASLAERMIDLYRTLRPGAAKFGFTVETVPARLFYGEGYEDSDRRVPDITAITRQLGWRPRVSLDDALRLSMEGFIKDYCDADVEAAVSGIDSERRSC